jgi:putative zinc finger/helix-turn-helix YgiT family protein
MKRREKTMSKHKPDLCPACGEGDLENVNGEFKTQIEGQDGQPMTLSVPNLSWRHCRSCGEDLLNEDASAAITKAHRAALKLLTSEEIRSIRQNLGKTQAQMSELLGIGEKTYCRWESGTHFQSEAFDRYLRLLQAVPEMVDVLNEIRLAKEGAAQSAAVTFSYLENAAAYESTSERFVRLLQTGPFQLQPA